MNIEELLESNSDWAKKITKEDPDFFKRLSKQQNPEYLWIGCADSRVPANQIIDIDPGEVFVHRNIANVVVHSDLNCLSVIQFAVEVLKVKHILVVGHYGCGGIRAALEPSPHGLIDNWLGHIKDVYRFHRDKVDECATEQERINLMCELNVREQVMNVCNTTIVRDAWARGQQLSVHGWVYSIEDGRVRDLSVRVSGADEINNALNNC